MNEQRERGSAAVLISASLVLVMAMASVAVDLSAGFNERRQDQTAADLAAMAGAISFLETDDAVSAALDIARENLNVDFPSSTDPDWVALWDGCSDTDRPNNFTPLPKPAYWPSGGTFDCISKSATSLRVRIPTQTIDTSFAAVVGANELSTFAVAQSTIVQGENGNGLLPFVVRAGESAGEVCLNSNTSGKVTDPCLGSQKGSFGSILSPTFGSSRLGTNPQCNSLDSLLAPNIANGVDHLIDIYRNAGWTYPIAGEPGAKSTVAASSVVVDECSVIGGLAIQTDQPTENINGVLLNPGFPINEITDGLVLGTGYTPLLRQTSGTETREVRNGNTAITLDSTPLWEYLIPGSSSVVPSCNGAAIAAHSTLIDRNAAMNQCLLDHAATPGAGVIFDDAIDDAPRFGWAPQLWHTDLSSQKWYPVKSYRNVYVAGTFYNCNAGSCGIAFYPGDPDTSQLCDAAGPNCRQIDINQLTGFLLPEGSISDAILQTFPGGSLGPFEATLER